MPNASDVEGTNRCLASARRWTTCGAIVACAACASQKSPQMVEIKAMNYSYQAPAMVSSGPTIFTLNNVGTVLHEAQIFRFRKGIPADSARHLLALESFPDSLADSSGAVLIAAPKTMAREQVYVDLDPGDVYGLVCQFRDSTGAKRHNLLGMFSVVEVRR